MYPPPATLDDVNSKVQKIDIRLHYMEKSLERIERLIQECLTKVKNT